MYKKIDRFLELDPHILLKGKFGLEKENLRVYKSGQLALTSHPKSLGDKGSHPYITVDFSESQVELITPPLSTVKGAVSFMETVQDVLFEQMDQEEYLWPQSSPSLLPPDEDIPVARYGSEDRDKEKYRETLMKIYGARRQTFSGIHFNFSFPQELLDFLGDDGSELYLRLVRNFLRHRWVLIWLYGCSPKFDKSSAVGHIDREVNRPTRFSSSDESSYDVPCKNAISLRVSKSGYRNKTDFTLDYSSIEGYVASVKELVRQGQIFSAKELYTPIRFKFDLEDSSKLTHVEVRIVDLDPFEKNGVSTQTLQFMHLFLLYMSLLDESSDFGDEEQKLSTVKHDVVACAGRKSDLEFTEGEPVLDELHKFIEDMKSRLESLSILDNEEYKSAFAETEKLLADPSSRVGVRVAEAVSDQGFVEFHMQQAEDFKRDSLKSGFKFHGLEDMELSTQLLLKAAILKGVNFEIIDRDENFIRLYRDSKEEYVVQATKTSLDSYSSILMMENKVVTKKVLDRGNIEVPKGREYHTLESAMADFYRWRDREIVIKPKSTNFGLGISIFKDSVDIDLYRRGLELAFEHDKTLLVEQFVHGREFRIFIIDGEVAGVLHRVPANITGDGVSTISQLIDIKNRDPLRGKGYKTPLEKIDKGEAEKIFLSTQNLTFESVVPDREIVYLRENSNVSTGGDSIDFTDELDSSYKQIAVDAAKYMGVRITGLDMMIEDIYAEATPDNYSVIEMNFNPAIHIHCYPYRGENRRLNEKIIEALGW